MVKSNICLLILSVIFLLTSCSAKTAHYSLVLTNLSGKKEVVADFYQSQSYEDCLAMLKTWQVNYPDAKCVTN